MGREERIAFEAAGGRQGGSVQITEYGPTGSLVSAGERAVYFPVRFIEPMNGNSVVKGFDLGSLSAYRTAMQQAWNSGEAMATQPVPLAQSRRLGVLVFVPIYRQHPHNRPLDQKYDVLEGFVLGVFDIEAVFAPLVKAARDRQLTFRVTDTTPGQPVQPLVGTTRLDANFLWHRELEFAGRRWRLDMQPTGIYWHPGASISLQLYLGLSVLVAFLTAFALLANAGHTAAITAAVIRRTATLRKELRARRVAEKRAEQANRAKSTFLAAMSHEIRTPMNGVLGMAELMAHHDLPDDQLKRVRLIRDSAFSLLRIIDDILNFSKIEAGRLELESEPVSVADIAEAVHRSLGAVAVAEAVDLKLFIAPRIPRYIFSDVTRLRQLLYNLVGNAIKFSGGQQGRRGNVSLRVNISDTTPLNLVFTITDNGIGISRENRNKLFTPFTQADASTTRHFGGTGRGLTICRRIVDMMHGDITVDSELGKGAVFTVTLPFKMVPDNAVDSLEDITGLDCIVVDTPAIDAANLRRYLEEGGARVVLASSRSDALRQAAGLAGPVVVGMADDIAAITAPNTCFVRIDQGWRRRARKEAPGLVILDADALERRELVRAVALAAGRLQGSYCEVEASETNSKISVPASSGANPRPLVLVAEDDHINQKVICQQLTLLGCGTEIAGTGKEALRLWRQGQYDLLITDLHMPDMDGQALATVIRKEESGQRHTPILIFTAHVLLGEMFAGVDEYLVKPVPLKTLKAALEKWLLKPPSTTAESKLLEEAPSHMASPTVELSLLTERVGGNVAAARELLEDYLESARELMGTLRSSSTAPDAQQVRAIAHRLKSSSLAVGALPLGRVCGDLEETGKTGDYGAMEPCMARLEAEFAAMEAAVTHLLSTEQSKGEGIQGTEP